MRLVCKLHEDLRIAGAGFARLATKEASFRSPLQWAQTMCQGTRAGACACASASTSAGSAISNRTTVATAAAAAAVAQSRTRGKATTYDGLPFFKHMFAGASAGMAEHVAMYPVDTLKTRMQAHTTRGQGSQLMSRTITKSFAAIIRKEGFLNLYSGVTAMAIGAGPAHGIYFAVYEALKDRFGANKGGHRPLETAAAATLATVISDGVMTPLDVVKQRLQLEAHPYKGTGDCIRSILRHEGVGAFFRSYQTTLVMNVPFACIHYSSYESAKKMLRQEDREEELTTQVLAGGIAGGVAGAATNPLDVVKTRLQTGGVAGSQRYQSSSVFEVLRNIVRTEGASALLRGVRPRVLFHMPAAAISWMTYESLKKLLLA